MKAAFVAIMIVALSLALLLPVANALTPRLDFSDNHFTYRTFGSMRICGDHICKPHEWEQWMGQLMENQLKNGGALPEESISSTSTANPTPSGAGNGLLDTSGGKITRVTTFDMGNNEFSSFVSISYHGYLNINHIVVSQANPGVSIYRAWIEPQWGSAVKSANVTFDSRDLVLYHNKVINAVIVTDGNPSFSLDTLSSNQIP
jgi:hypothetical protein